MVVEPSALIAAVEAIGALMKETVPLVQGIRSGIMAGNREAKERLTRSLEQLQNNLQRAGELARVAESYFQTHANVLELRSLCSRAEDFLKGNLEECRSRTSAGYAGNESRQLTELLTAEQEERAGPSGHEA